jgi:SAM-dependent methyltransferase
MTTHEYGGAASLDTRDTDPFSALQDQVAYMAASGPLRVPDVFQRGMLRAVEGQLGKDSAFTGLVSEGLSKHPGRLPVNWANLLMRTVQDYKLRNGYAGYPRGLERPENSADFFVALEDDEAEQAHFVRNIELNVQTNVPDRGVLLKAAALLMQKTGPLRILDVGCGRNHIGRKLAHPAGHEFSEYHPVDVMDSSDRRERLHVASHNFNRLVTETTLPVQTSIGIDIQDMLIGDTREQADKMRLWSRHCFYPSEYLYGGGRIREFDHWEDVHLPNVRFFQGDILDFDHDHFRYLHPDTQPYDAAYFSTVGYQLGHDGMQTAIANIRPYLKPDGFIAVQDFVDITPDNTMHFARDWPKWSYGMYTLDLAKEEDGFQKFFTSESGRVGKIVIEEAAGRLAVKRSLELAA